MFSHQLQGISSAMSMQYTDTCMSSGVVVCCPPALRELSADQQQCCKAAGHYYTHNGLERRIVKAKLTSACIKVSTTEPPFRLAGRSLLATCASD